MHRVERRIEDPNAPAAVTAAHTAYAVGRVTGVASTSGLTSARTVAGAPFWTDEYVIERSVVPSNSSATSTGPSPASDNADAGYVPVRTVGPLPYDDTTMLVGLRRAPTGSTAGAG